MTQPGRCILVASDFSRPATHAVEYACLVARALPAELHVAHAWHRPGWMGLSDEPDLLDRLRDSVQQRLDEERARIDGLGIRCAVHLEEGPPSAIVSELAGRLRAELLVVGSRGRSGLKYVLLGSAAQRLMRLAPCPVLVVPEAAPIPDRPLLRRIVVGVDLSPASRRALAAARRLGEGLGRPRLILAHASPVRGELEGLLDGLSSEALDGDTRRRLKQLDGWVRELVADGVDAVSRVISEPAEDQLVELARRENADLLAVGTHGHSVAHAIALGGTSERVARTSPCPVLAMK